MSQKEIEKLIHIPVNSIKLEGMLQIPEDAAGIILFAHGSGSSRLSPRNNFVAKVLHRHKFATLLIDLLTEEEDELRENRFDIELLTERLAEAAKWLASEPQTQNLPLGIFGASTGAASALYLASRLGKKVFAVVSRGGRPDMAEHVLPKVVSPVLLIVGGNDDVVIELNQLAYLKLKSEKKLQIIPGATHLFEEPGALETVANLAAEWFQKHLPR